MTDASPPVAVLLTQVAAAEDLAAACALAGTAVLAAPTDVGALAVCLDVGPEQPERAAAAVSRALVNTQVLLLVRREGRVTASRWARGEREQDVAAVLVLDGAPAVVEELLLGRTSAQDLPGVVSSRMSRWRAARRLTASARSRRRG